MVINGCFLETSLKRFREDHCSLEIPPVFKAFGVIRSRLEEVNVEALEKAFIFCLDQFGLRGVFNTNPCSYFFMNSGMKVRIRYALGKPKLS